MKDWFVRHDVLARVLSVVAALLVWSYIVNTQNPSRTLEYRDIPVTFTGSEDLYNNYSLTIISGQDATVDVKVSASSSRLANLTASQIKVTVNLSDITTSGTYDMPYDVSLPESGMTCVSRSPNTVTIAVDKEYTKSVPVEVHIAGDLPSGFVNEEPELSTKHVNITGPESELNNVSAAVVTIDGSKLTATLSGNYEYTLVDKNGNRVDTTNISRETSRVPVTVEVKQIKTVPLYVNLTPKGSTDGATVSISPKQVKIVGIPDTVAAVDSITLGSINITDAQDGDTFDYNINVPSGVELMDGQPTTAQATLSLDNTIQKQFTVTDITLSDKSSEEGTQAVLATDSLNVRISGMASALDSLKAEDISAVAEIRSSQLSTGEHSIGVTIKVPDGLTVVGTYSVKVSITRSGDTDTTDPEDNRDGDSEPDTETGEDQPDDTTNSGETGG